MLQIDVCVSVDMFKTFCVLREKVYYRNQKLHIEFYMAQSHKRRAVKEA